MSIIIIIQLLTSTLHLPIWHGHSAGIAIHPIASGVLRIVLGEDPSRQLLVPLKGSLGKMSLLLQLHESLGAGSEGPIRTAGQCQQAVDVLWRQDVLVVAQPHRSDHRTVDDPEAKLPLEPGA